MLTQRVTIAQNSLSKAISIAVQAHAGQKDLVGEPYISHPIRVMQRINNYDTQIVAVLHDVIEDHPSFKEVITNTFFSSTLDALLLLNRKESKFKSYFDYIDNIIKSKDDIAIAVKYFDLIDNLDLTRFTRNGIEITESVLLRYNKYLESKIRIEQKYISKFKLGISDNT
ncbi:MAG: bifunctional (p)ppGpp synthetase/guanosine-3',5'-bis(diphosphate) 3'-pyrophosphohydrolase [Deltaproteobacteria bacterium]|nr:bifunctional (p)ppGpp synthetase/guanosine-3',5'-bis(diphosphate) 3'-pyrophosphohydrolase [Deltaproteobacteria bacterium]